LIQKPQDITDISDNTTTEELDTSDDEKTIYVYDYDELFTTINVEDYQWKEVDDDPDISITDIYKNMEELAYENYVDVKCESLLKKRKIDIEELYKEIDLKNDVASIDEIDDLIEKAFISELE
jgi:hypothetical protein